ENSLKEIACGNYRLEKRIKLKIEGHPEALNDIVIMPEISFRVINLLIFVNDHFLTEVVGDGVIVSTPTGSTAYSLSAGGPIICPEMEGLVINSISPHSLSLRPIVVPSKSEVKVTLCSESAIVAIDGQKAAKIHKGDQIKIKKSDNYTTLLKLTSLDYFSTLRTKLKLGDTKMRTSCDGCKKRAQCPFFNIDDD
ncbi:NAD(+)/NADH kinase, partial [candidate division WOR-3 bacterium]|nr:NAD(+)/NADH kinase [candidate division WOR-3 bacterium]